MLSYQHAYHAGNFVDCHKHSILCALMAALQTKDSAITFYDFFAGRGIYSLQSPEASKTREYVDGIDKVWPRRADAPAVIQAWLDSVAYDNPKDDLALYAGSPLLVKRHLRPQDKLVCVEAHPQEHAALTHTLGFDTSVTIHKRDAWEAMGALIPPKGDDKTPRSLAIIDPAYEVKSDYMVLVKEITQALQRWSHGLFFVWYPLLPAGLHKDMLDAFQQQITHKTLNSQLIIKNPPQDRGMYGSGLLIVNPPWQFHGIVQEIGDWLISVLGQDDSARHSVEWLIQEK